MNIDEKSFGTTKEGADTLLYTLTNDSGFTVKITNYGATITSVLAADKNGQMEDVVLGFDSVDEYQGDEYLKSGPYFGAILGRYSNRIAKGKFTIDKTAYTLAINNGENHLHGGLTGFDKVVWDSEKTKGEDFVGVTLRYLSKDMEEGFPGNLQVEVLYKVTNDNEIIIEYSAVTDKKTVLNLTNHSYFNLTGGKRNHLDHEVQIFANEYTEVDADAIPTGNILTVKDTPLDFTTPHTIGERIEQLPTGYDHNYVLNNVSKRLVAAAKVVEPESGRVLETFTTEPGVQFYTAWFLGGTFEAKGVKCDRFRGFCFETQHYPDSPNQSHFPTTLLKAGDTYTQKTVYKFS